MSGGARRGSPGSLSLLLLAAPLLGLAPATLASVPRGAAVLSSPSRAADVDARVTPRLEHTDSAGFRVFAGDELGAAPFPLFELGYPETRVGGFGLPGEARVRAERSLSLEAPWACDEPSCGRATGSGEFRIFDPTGSSRSASAFGWNRLFQGREYIGLIDAYDFRARTLWPEIGRFGQEDPEGTGDSTNLSQALGAAWTSIVDPFGTMNAHVELAWDYNRKAPDMSDRGKLKLEVQRLPVENLKSQVKTLNQFLSDKKYPDRITLSGPGLGADAAVGVEAMIRRLKTPGMAVFYLGHARVQPKDEEHGKPWGEALLIEGRGGGAPTAWTTPFSFEIQATFVCFMGCRTDDVVEGIKRKKGQVFLANDEENRTNLMVEAVERLLYHSYFSGASIVDALERTNEEMNADPKKKKAKKLKLVLRGGKTNFYLRSEGLGEQTWGRGGQ